MRECLVGLCHSVRIFLLLYGSTGTVGRIHELLRELLGHGLFTSGPGVRGEPSEAQRLTTFCAYFNRYLIVGTADTSGFDFNNRHDVVHCFFKDFQGFFTGLVTNLLEGIINDGLCRSLLPVSGSTSLLGTFPFLGTSLPSLLLGFGYSVPGRQNVPGRACVLCLFQEHIPDLNLLFLRSLSTVLGTRLISVRHTSGIQSAADDVITDTRDVLNSSAADQHNAVLLQIVTNTGDVSGNFDPVGQSDSGDLSQCRIRFLRGDGLDGCANASLLRGVDVGGLSVQGIESFAQSGSRRLLHTRLSALTNQLVDGRHILSPFSLAG